MLPDTLDPCCEMVDDPGIPEGEVHGYSLDGRLLCVVAYLPTFTHTDYAEGDVAKWKVSPGYLRRLKLLVWWKIMDYHVEGRA